ncbi:MAG: hypothetical protein M3277_09780 [Actinomycetota bacterium]|nr:hypothetical protein [Actinomycetota bacterium]
MRKILYLLMMAALALAVVPATALADHEDGVYELPAQDDWDKARLRVYVVPPSHGQLYNGSGPLAGGDPNEVTPFQNSYLRAIEDSIEEWNRGIRQFGSEELKKRFKASVYVLGRDELPDQSPPDILVVTDENKGPVLGFAAGGEPCIVNNSQMFIRSFTYADMYNVMGQEYGHCLGLGHVGSQGGIDPTSERKHPEHDVMNGFYADPVGSLETHLHCVSTLDVKGLEYTFVKTLTDSGETMPVYLRVPKYRTTCGGDGRPSPEDPDA